MEKGPDHPVRVRRRPGFTLVELALVIATISIVAAIAVPRYTNATTRYRIEAAARRIAADVDATQQEAIATSSTRGFTPATTGYVIWKLDAGSNKVATQSVRLGNPPYSITSLSITVNGDPNVLFQFDGYGKPSGTGAFVVQAGGQTRTVTANAVTGKAAVN